MKIGIDIRALNGIKTGIGKYLLHQLDSLANLDNNNEYALFYNSLTGELPSGIPQQDNFRVVRTKIPNRILNVCWAYTALPKVQHLIGGLDLFYSPNYQMPPSGNTPGVLTIHDLVFYHSPEMAIPAAVRHYRRRIKFYSERANVIISDSKATTDDIIKYLDVNPDKISTIYLGAIPLKRNDKINLEMVRAKYKLDKPYMLFVGCLEPRKNMTRLFKAFEKAGLYKDIDLVLAGPKGWYFEELLNEWNGLKSKDIIRWLNYVSDEDLARLYEGAMFFTFPSIFEGFGLPILEAMSAGCPVLTSNKSSMPEVAGDAALYVDPLEIDSIASGMLKLVESKTLRNDLSDKGRERVKLFTWDKSAKQLLSVFENYRSA